MPKEGAMRKVKDQFVMFLTKQVNPPPLLFFGLYVYSHLDIQSPEYVAYTFFISGIIFALLFSYNHFYIYSSILNAGIGYWSVLNMSIGILAANQKWKLYLYLFIMGDSITINYPEISKVYVICCSMYLWIDIYRNLIFKKVEDNIKFFTGFFTIFIFQLVSKVISEVDGYSGIAYFTVPFSILIGYKLISNRVQLLKKKNILKIRNVEEVYHYIYLIKQEISSPYSRQGYLQTHKNNCSSASCFCSQNHLIEGKVLGEILFSTKIQYYFIRNLFQQVLSIKAIPKKQFLYNKFIEFLIENNQVTEAIQLYTKLESLSPKFYYFRWVQRARIYFKIEEKLQELNYFNAFSKQFKYVFQYDHSYLYLASEIKQILKKKVDFWKQVGKQMPLMKQLQQFGSLIVQKMYDLNNFYYKQIKQQEEKINNFNGTIMYAMYLLSTTNYKEFAESLIKNTSRTLQSIKIHEENIAQTYGLQMSIRDSKKSCNQKIQVMDSIVNSSDVQTLLYESNRQEDASGVGKQNAKRFIDYQEDGFVEMISNISGSLCKLLNSSKNDLLGKDLSTIIPISYQERHHSKLQKLLHYDNKTNKQIANLSFINKIRQVPLKTIDNKLMTVKISVKIFQAIEEGISFIALVQTINENKVTIITDLQGRVQQYQEGLKNLKIIECEQISSVISNLKDQWEKKSTISVKKINLTFHDNNYSVTFGSPYQYSFFQRQGGLIDENGESEDQNKRLHQSLYQGPKLTPPIHIDIINQSIPNLMNAKQDRQEEMTKCIKKMESVFYKTDIDSQSSTNSSRKSSVVNVLMSFSENYFIPFYGYIMAVFVLILIASITGNSIGYSQLNLAWNNNMEPKNPIVNIISTMDIRALMIQTINHQEDYNQYISNSLINKTNVDKFYGLDKTNYSEYLRQKMRRIEKKYKVAVTSTSMYISEVLSQSFDSAWQRLIDTTNPNNQDQTKRVQQLPIQNIFMNYLVDLDLLSVGKSFSRTIIYLNFWSTIQYFLSQISTINNLIHVSIDNSVVLNILYCCIISIVISLSIIPVYILLKKRVKRHIDIYDLIVSVEGELIRQQIKKLDNIITIVNNSNESSEVLKTNTINYLARKRSDANSDNLAGSNEMIKGLIQNDSVIDPQAENFIAEGQDTKAGFFTKTRQTIDSNSKNDQDEGIFSQQTKKLALRKRSGELDLKGSQGDFKRVICKHWVLYFIIIISTFGLCTMTISKINYFGSVKKTFFQIQGIYSNYIEESLLLHNAKLYFRGMSKVDFKYHDTTFINWLEKNIYQNAALKYGSSISQQKIYPPCDGSSVLMSKYLYCQSNYSLLTLRQQVDHYIKQTYQKRLNFNAKYNITKDNMTNVPQQQLAGMSEHFFYVQSMSDRIFNITRSYISDKLEEMKQEDVRLNITLRIVFIIGLGWGIICLFLGIILINHMKNLYFKEIIIVSFLNNEMISKNKRVQSFLQTLSKSSY